MSFRLFARVFPYQGLVEPDEIESFGAMLLEQVEFCNDHIDCGILGTKYVLNVLTDLGHADVACRIAMQKDYPNGPLRSEWHIQGGRFSLNVSIPPNSSATIHLPTTDPSGVHESGRPVQAAAHVSFCRIESGRAVYMVGAGSYRFETDMS